MRNEEGVSGIEDVKKYEELRENGDNYWEVGDRAKASLST